MKKLIQKNIGFSHVSIISVKTIHQDIIEIIKVIKSEGVNQLSMQSEME